MNALKLAEIQAALEAVEAGDAKRLEPLLKTNPALVHQILEHDDHSVMPQADTAAPDQRQGRSGATAPQKEQG